MTIFEELKARGLLAQLTDEEEIKELIADFQKCVFSKVGYEPDLHDNEAGRRYAGNGI